MRSRVWTTSLAIAICVSTALAQHDMKKPAGSASEAPSMPNPEPGPEMRRLLEAFSGTWSITYGYDQSDTMPNNGTGQGREVYRPGPGGFSLIEEFHSKEAKGDDSGLGVAWWDEKARGFRAVWCESRNPKGCVVMARLANWEGDQFVLGDEWEMGGKKFSFKEVFSDMTPRSFTQTLLQGESGGELKRLMTIKATKLTDAEPAGSKAPKQ
jgi:hypothetical protein